MKTNKLFVSFVALLVAIFAISSVLAGTMNVSIDEVEVNDNSLATSTLAQGTGEDIEVKVRFTVTDSDDIDDVKLKVWISGYKDDIDASTGRFDALSGRTYTKTLSLTLPNVKDIEDLDEDLTLHVELSDKNDDIESEYVLTVQRESYTYDLLSVEAPATAAAGDIVALDVVLKNIGTKELEDSFVTARIPELGVYKKVYFGDITPEDNFEGDDDAEDARERRVYLVIPADTITGTYDIEVKASNYDASSKVVKNIAITGLTAEEDVIDATEDEEGIPNSVIVLTVVLVIIFLVLLIVLVILLTKKPEEKLEDFGETSYY